MDYQWTHSWSFHLISSAYKPRRNQYSWAIAISSNQPQARWCPLDGQKPTRNASALAFSLSRRSKLWGDLSVNRDKNQPAGGIWAWYPQENEQNLHKNGDLEIDDLRPIPSPEVPAIENLDPLRPRGVREPWEHWKHHRSSSKVPTPATAKGLSWNLHSSRGLGEELRESPDWMQDGSY